MKLKSLIILSALLAAGCSRVSPPANSVGAVSPTPIPQESATPVTNKPDVKPQPIIVCGVDLRQPINIFFQEGEPQDAEQVVKRLKKSCPRQKVINSLLSLREAHKEDYGVQLNSAYLLVRLKYEEKVYRKAMIDLFRSEAYTRNETPGHDIFEMIYDVYIEDDSAEGTTDLFELCGKADGHNSELLAEMLVKKFNKNPPRFLQALALKSAEVKEEVFFLVLASTSKEKLQKRLRRIPQSSEAYPIMLEFLEFTKNNKYSL